MNKQTVFRGLFFLMLLARCFCTVAQTHRIDSVKKNLVTAMDNRNRLNNLIALCREQSSLNADSLFRYATITKMLAKAEGDSITMALANYYIGSAYLTLGHTDSSLAIADKALRQLHYSNTEKEAYADFVLLQARALNNTSRSKEAFNLLYPLLTLAEKNEDSLIQIRAIMSMVAAFVSTSNEKDAIRWCVRAFQLFPQPIPLAYQEMLGITLNNTSLAYMHLYENSGAKSLLDSAEKYTTQAVLVNTRNQYLGSLAYSLSQKATVMGISNNVAEGEKLLVESLAVQRQMGNKFYIINTMAVMGNFYGITKQPQKGIAICKEGIEYNKGDRPNIYLYVNLAGNYKLAGEYKLYGETMEQIIAIKDSLHIRNSAEALSEMQTRYETQKKENTIIQQNYALAKKNYLAYGALSLLLTGGIFFIILIRINRKKQEFKFQMIQKEEKRLNDIAVTNAEEKERTRIAAELHDNLGGQLSYISSNMDFILDGPLSLTEAQKKNHLRKVNETAKTTIADLRESIWALKKQQVDILELADKIKLYVQNHLHHRQEIQLEVEEEITGKSTVSSAEGLNIFRIFQEAVNNALKYSGASLLTLRIETGTGRLYSISLRDNGKGFDTQLYYPGHYGLENMRSRAKAIDAVLEIQSESQVGSTVKLFKKEQLVSK